MKIIRGRHNLPNNLSPSVVTLGNFDGVHLGHQNLLIKTHEEGQRLQAKTIVIVFEPQPSEFFLKSSAPARLTSLREKFLFIKEFSIDYLYVLPFNESLAKINPDEFILNYLVNDLSVRSIVVGDDFKFGCNRSGNSTLLKKYAERLNYHLIEIDTHQHNGLRVSSTQVRMALSQDDFDSAKLLLGRNYQIIGNVIYGNQLARQLGFPTANINMNRKNPALHGVYLVRVYHQESNSFYYGIANIGLRPTINGTHSVLEVHLFDFSKMIYGHHLQVNFIKKIRNEVKFSSIENLKIQIAEDICKAKEIKAELFE